MQNQSPSLYVHNRMAPHTTGYLPHQVRGPWLQMTHRQVGDDASG